VALDYIPANDVFFSLVIGALGDNVGSQNLNQVVRSILVKQKNSVDAALSRYDPRPIPFWLNGTARPFEAPDRPVSINANEQRIALAARLL
jgi:hypothetical protein